MEYESLNLVFININHNPSVFRLIMDTIPYLPGWKADVNTDPNNVHWKNLKNKTASVFSFDIDDGKFSWYGEYPKPGITPIPIHTEAAASKLLDIIYVLTIRKIPSETAVKLIYQSIPEIMR